MRRRHGRTSSTLPLATPLFLVWALAVLALSRPWAGLTLRAIAAAWRSDRPASAFARGMLAANWWRLAGGHFAAVAVVAALFGLGAGLLGLFRPRQRLDRADRLVFAAALGAGAGIAGFLGLGCCGLWAPAVGWAVAAAGWWMGWRRVAATLGVSADAETPPPAGAEWLSAAAAVVAVLLVAAASLDLDAAEDALVYHLALPLRFAADHRVTGLAGVFHSSFPQGGPMLYGWLLLLGGEPAVRAWRPWLVAGLCAVVVRLGARACGRRRRSSSGRWNSGSAGWLTAGLVATLPYTFWLGPATMPDLECAGLLLAAALALRSGGGFRRGSGVLSMALAAAACGIKYQALFAVPAVVLAASGWRRPSWRRLAVAVILVLAAVAPWWWRNAVATGNPVFPYAARVFPSFVPRPATVGPRLELANRSYMITGAGDLPLLPWRLSTVGRGAPLGPLFLLGAPLLLLVRPLGAAAFPAAVAGVALACWVPVSHNARYALAAWILLAVAIAIAAREARARSRGLASVALAAFLVLEVTGLARAWVATAPRAASYLTGRDTPAARRERTAPFPFGTAAAGLDRVAPVRAGTPVLGRTRVCARVLIVGDAHGAYWGRPTVWSSLFDVPEAEVVLRTSRTGAEAAKRFRQLAPFVYVSDPAAGSAAFDWGNGSFALDAREAAVAAATWARWMVPVATGPSGTVWRVRSTPAGTPSSAALPLVFRPEAFRRAYGPWTAVSWDGAGGRATAVTPR